MSVKDCYEELVDIRRGLERANLEFEVREIRKHLRWVERNTDELRKKKVESDVKEFEKIRNELKQANSALREIYWGFDIKLYILLGLLALILWRVW